MVVSALVVIFFFYTKTLFTQIAWKLKKPIYIYRAEVKIHNFRNVLHVVLLLYDANLKKNWVLAENLHVSI